MYKPAHSHFIVFFTNARHLTLFLQCPLPHATHISPPTLTFSCPNRCAGVSLIPYLCISLDLLNHLGTLAHLQHCPYVPLPDLHTRFWRQQFHRRFLKRYSLPCTLIQPGIDILFLCFPTVGRSGNTSFGFCNIK